MKQITQTAEVAYFAIEIQDAITMLPVMDKLSKDLQNYLEIWKENRESEDSWKQKRAKEACIEAHKIYDQLRVLHKVGFVTSVPDFVLCPSEFLDTND